MSNQRLNISQVDGAPLKTSKKSSKGSQRQEIQATMERMWLLDPQQFNPERNVIERQRIERTVEAMKASMDLVNKRAVDLGCGYGVLSRIMRDAGSYVDAVDVSLNALKKLQEYHTHHIRPIQDCLPMTSLEDDTYDIVVCTETIGHLPTSAYRLCFTELSRLLKNNGYVVCSTELDLNSDDSLERFNALIETEFTIDQWVFSHHRLLLKLCYLTEYPEKKLLKSRYLRPLWKLLSLPLSPLSRILRQSHFMMNLLEKICRFFCPESGISHALFIGKRRPMTFPLPPSDIPQEMPHKRQVWT